MNERIEKIKPYFRAFNISDGATCIAVHFPKWQMPDNEILKRDFKTQLTYKDGNYFFLSEMENGPEVVFDAIDFVVMTNRELEKKQELLEKKAKELTDLFITEPLEKLETLQFVFGNNKRKTPIKTKISKASQKEEENTKDIENEITKNLDITKIEINEEVNDDNESCGSLMSLAMKMNEE